VGRPAAPASAARSCVTFISGQLSAGREPPVWLKADRRELSRELMSRVGKKIIEVPKDVKVKVTDSTVEVEGPKGKLVTPVPSGISFRVEGNQLTAERESDE